jgi:methyl-accepting chemotaxis protein
MQTSFWTVQRKMLFPALAAAAATVVATIVTLTLSSRAADRLSSVESRDLPVLQFYQGMLDSLKEVHLLLLNVGESENFDRITETDDLHEVTSKRIQEEGTKTVGAGTAQQINDQFDEYYAAGRQLAATRVQAQLKAKRAIASVKNDLRVHSDSTSEERKIAAATSEVENKYNDLADLFTEQVNKASATMKAAFADAKSVQVFSILVGAAILFGSAFLAIFFAWVIAVRTSRPLYTLSQVTLRIADGDLTQEVKVETSDEVGVLASSFRRMVARLRALVGTLKTAAEELAAAAEQLSDHTRAQAAMLERQASGVAETTSTTRELEQASSVAASRAASVLEVARRAADMSDVGSSAAEKSAGELQRIQASVTGIMRQSSGLLEQARQVGDIVETVRDLATQSHVLSLNASIEASKAGEAGKSFNVVAQEVRALAEQSGESAGRIGRIVGDILTAVEGTRDLTERGSRDMNASLSQIRTSGESLREIGSIVRETSDAALQIATAVQQQSAGIGQIAIAMRDLDKGMEQTVERIRALEHSAQQVAETAIRISGIAAEFTV